jgi:hypothetical protein
MNFDVAEPLPEKEIVPSPSDQNIGDPADLPERDAVEAKGRGGEPLGRVDIQGKRKVTGEPGEEFGSVGSDPASGPGAYDENEQCKGSKRPEQ